MAQDFWRNSGFHLLDRDAAGRLLITDDFLRAYFLRPEIRPVEESGPAERVLHDSLLAEPYPFVYIDPFDVPWEVVPDEEFARDHVWALPNLYTFNFGMRSLP